VGSISRFRECARVVARIVRRELDRELNHELRAKDARIEELLRANNHYQEEARAARGVIRDVGAQLRTSADEAGEKGEDDIQIGLDRSRSVLRRQAIRIGVSV